TIHKAKGLEWPIVFCPYLWSESKLRGDEPEHVRFHDEAGRLALDVGSPDRKAHQALALEEARAEDLRLLYVALTRARHQCSIVWGGFTTAKESPLGRFLAPADFDPGNDVAIRRHLDSLAARAEGRIAIRALPLDEPPRLGLEGGNPAELARATFAREPLDDCWRTTSFSALAASLAGESAQSGVDHDELAAAPESALAEKPPDRVRLADFPAGARAGSLVHEILERIDFRRRDPAELPRVVDSRLRAFGFEEIWREPLVDALAGLLETPLRIGDSSVRLADVPPHKRLTEMEFTLPLGRAGGGAHLTPERLAAAFDREPSGAIPRGYGERLRSLGFRALSGYLRGYVDLVFEAGGRFFVIDWK
ncbi:MAG: 3'-5' exonuclease, partial [Candidatus Binatia bacterium]